MANFSADSSSDNCSGKVFWCIWVTTNTLAFLRQWCAEVDAAKIPVFMKFANTVRAHWSGIVHFVESRITNGIQEGINSKVQLAKWLSQYQQLHQYDFLPLREVEA